MQRWTALLGVALGLGCGGKDGDSGGPDGTVPLAPYMNILSPSAGQFIDEGDDVLLEVEGRDGAGALVDATDVAWSASEVGWGTSGNAVTVNDLPAGLYDLSVTAVVEGVDVSASVEVAVYAASGAR